MKKTVIDFLLLDNKQLNKDNFKLTLQSPLPVSDIYPGQFINVEIKESTERKANHIIAGQDFGKRLKKTD